MQSSPGEAKSKQSSGHKVHYSPDQYITIESLELLLLPVAEAPSYGEWKSLVVFESSETPGAYESVGYFWMGVDPDQELPKSEFGEQIIKLV